MKIACSPTRRSSIEATRPGYSSLLWTIVTNFMPFWSRYFLLLLIVASQDQNRAIIILLGVGGDGSWIDPATPTDVRTTVGMDNRVLDLVFSDEFEDDQRRFGDGFDSRWTAEDCPGTTNAALHYYNSSAVTTRDGKLVIETTSEQVSWTEHDDSGREYSFTRAYKSGLVSSWNKFCFTSGVIEISLQLPGRPEQGGAWPAFWMLGNLARMSYLKSSEGVWPWSWDECGTSDEAGQMLQGQQFNKCNAEHQHGRGSPEIDIVEAMPGNYVLDYHHIRHMNGSMYNISIGRPMISTSLQLAPGVAKNRRPNSPGLPRAGEWYEELYPMGGKAYGPNVRSLINNYWYGQVINEDPEIWQDGLSVNIQHGLEFYKQQTVLRTEWQTGKEDGYVRWFWGDHLVYEITADTLKSKPGANDTIPLIPYEPMYLILNVDISPKWGWNGCNPYDPCMLANPGLCSPKGELTCTDCSNPDCLRCPHQTGWLAAFCVDIHKDNPMKYEIDWVRIYQDRNDATHTVGCNPPEYPTRNIINKYWERYTFDPWLNKQPLLPVKLGEGECATDADCGSALRGRCNDALKRCTCFAAWTGPNCATPRVGDYAVCGELAASFRNECRIGKRLCTDPYDNESCGESHEVIFERLCNAASCDAIRGRYVNCSVADQVDYMLGQVMGDLNSCCDIDALANRPCGETTISAARRSPKTFSAAITLFVFFSSALSHAVSLG